MKHTLTLAVVMLAMVCACLSACDNPADKVHLTYSHGVNDALEYIILLDLELDLKGERKTWGEMCNIVRKRLNVKESK